MRTPDDLRHFDSSQHDAFQLIPPHYAGLALLALVLILAALEPVLR